MLVIITCLLFGWSGHPGNLKFDEDFNDETEVVNQVKYWNAIICFSKMQFLPLSHLYIEIIFLKKN